MLSQAEQARQRYIERLKPKPDKDQPTTKQSRFDSAPSANNARQAMIARIAGRTYSNPVYSKTQYREDANDTNDPVGWYRTLLQNSGYNNKQIQLMLGEQR
jgi:hypothetical protein